MKGCHVLRVTAHDCIKVGGLVAAPSQRYVDLQRIACYCITTITYYRELVAADIAADRYRITAIASPTASSLATSPRPRDPTPPSLASAAGAGAPYTHTVLATLEL
jgi:hypothetical protein